MPRGPKVARRDLREDRVYVALVGAANFVVRNRFWIGLGVLVILVAFASGYYGNLRSQRLANEASWALYQARELNLPSERTAALRAVTSEYGGSAAARIASFEIADTFYDNGRYEEALEAFEEFLKKNPNHLLAPAALEAIGYCRESLGQWKEAIDTYLKLIDKQPETSEAKRANYRLGLCYENLGEKEKAVEAYEKAMELLPDSLWAEYSNERLTLLRPPASSPADAAVTSEE